MIVYIIGYYKEFLTELHTRITHRWCSRISTEKNIQYLKKPNKF